MKRVAYMFALAALLGFYGCGDYHPVDPNGPPPSGAAWLNVVLTTPNDDDGGIIFKLSGAQIDSVEAVVEGFFASTAENGAWTVLITGELKDGPIARVRVADPEEAGEVEWTVEQAAARSYALRDVGGYTLQIVPD